MIFLTKVDKISINEVQQVGEEEKRTLRFVASNELQDRDGDIIESSGWKLDNYKKNPVILFGHDYKGLPVGKAITTEIDPYKKSLVQEIQFPTRDEYEFGDTVYKLAKAGYLNALSVGFAGIESISIYDDGSEVYNGKNKFLGKRYKKQELIEVSIVPVPSNPQALIEARSKGIIDDVELKTLSEIAEKVEKAGASISAKNKEELGAIHDLMKGCGERLKKFLDDNMPMMDDEPPEDEPPEDKAKKNESEVNTENEITEIKKALREIKEVLFLLQKTEKEIPEEIQPEIPETPPAPDESEIDIDALVDEDPNEIDLTDEEFEKALSNMLDEKLNQIKGGQTL